MSRIRPSRQAFLASLPIVAATMAPLRAQSPSVRVSIAPVESAMEPYYAADMGFFAKAGLDVQITPVTSGAASITGVVTGALDVGISTVPQLASAVLRGVSLQYIAGAAIWDSSAPFAGMVVAKDSPIRTARDFEGKTIAILALHDGTHLVAMAYLVKNGADPSKVSFIETPFSTMLPAVSSGRVAGALSASPFMPGPNDDTRVLATAYDTLGDRYLALGFFSTAEWIKANAPVARRFAATMYETARWANTKSNQPRAAEIFEKYAKVPQATIQRMVRATFAERLEPAMIDPYLDWAFRVKFHERRVRPQEMIAAL